MKAEFFKAVCPLEIGDTVAIKVSKDGETKEALYLPQGCTVITTAAVALHKVTDIATLHYLKKVKHSSCMNWTAAGSMNR
jgi:hypothetical protein